MEKASINKAGSIRCEALEVILATYILSFEKSPQVRATINDYLRTFYEVTVVPFRFVLKSRGRQFGVIQKGVTKRDTGTNRGGTGRAILQVGLNEFRDEGLFGGAVAALAAFCATHGAKAAKDYRVKFGLIDVSQKSNQRRFQLQPAYAEGMRRIIEASGLEEPDFGGLLDKEPPKQSYTQRNYACSDCVANKQECNVILRFKATDTPTPRATLHGTDIVCPVHKAPLTLIQKSTASTAIPDVIPVTSEVLPSEIGLDEEAA